MKRDSNHILNIRNNKKKAIASFRKTNKLTILNSKVIKLDLMNIVTSKNSELEINLEGIKFIDSSIIDVFNLVSRMAKRYNSNVILTNISSELMELIELVKLHSVFDVRTDIPVYIPKNVA